MTHWLDERVTQEEASWTWEDTALVLIFAVGLIGLAFFS